MVVLAQFCLSGMDGQCHSMLQVNDEYIYIYNHVLKRKFALFMKPNNIDKNVK